MGLETIIIIWLVAFILGILVGASISHPRNTW
jgi:hypothetical protein